MKKFLEEFKEFAVRGNVIELAVAVIIGNAINAIAKSLVNNIFMPIIGIFVGRVDITSLKLVIPSRLTHGSDITIGYGVFLQSVLDFLTTAFCIFIMLKFVKKVSNFSIIKGKEEQEENNSEPLKTEDLLVEIRDILKEQSAPNTKSDIEDDFDNEH